MASHYLFAVIGGRNGLVMIIGLTASIGLFLLADVFFYHKAITEYVKLTKFFSRRERAITKVIHTLPESV